MRCFSLLAFFLAVLTHPASVPVAAQTSGSTCRAWLSVLSDLQTNLFGNGQCYSHALRKSGQFGGGGADGSLIQFANIELTSPANKGLHGIVHDLQHVADAHNVSYGDIIQFAGAVGLSNCRGAPRLAFFAGRPQATAPSPPHLFPAPTDDAEAILRRMQDAGFSAEDTVALLGAHSIGKQRTIDPAVSGMPLDSTPSVFDSQYYLQMLLKGTVYPRKAPHDGEALSATKDVFRFYADAAIAHSPTTACAWQSFIGQEDDLRSSFSRAMLKVATLGHRLEDLTDCSEVIPVPPVYNGSAQYPAGLGRTNVEQACSSVDFPTLPNE